MKFLGPPSSGSIAGTTHSHGRAGQYTRNRRTPVQPVGSGRRAFVRAAFGTASVGWSALTDAQRAAWSSYADGYPYVDSLGQAIKLTGHQMFVAIGTNLINCGEALPTTPPESNETVSPVVTVFTVTAAGVIVITMPASGTADDFILVSFSRPVSAGVSFMKTFWQQTVVAGNATTVTSPGTAYVTEFGLPTAGQKVFLKLTPINEFGVAGVPTQMSAIAS